MPAIKQRDLAPAARDGVLIQPRRSADGAAATVYDSDIAPVAALLADRARAQILLALLDGLPRPAGELSRLAGVSPATASAHLARLLRGGMLAVDKQGRHRYYRLSGPEVASLIEAVAVVSPVLPARGLRQSREAAALARARSCYDHLAGQAGVALLDALLAGGMLAVRAPGKDGSAFEVTGAGTQTLARFGVDVTEVRRARRRFAGSCLDWTERRPHLGGALGAAIMTRLLRLGWIEHGRSRRSIRVTPAGADGLAATFGWSSGESQPGSGR
ncbi:MAG TPA: helix-turn-helix domain-containing protein [Streptosporangiaceae bacterium]|jgi:DNA-binding transcriptional ArsR family regulator